MWVWQRGKGITVHLLRGDRYEAAPRSALLPALDLRWIERFAMDPNQAKAVREFRAILRASPAARKPTSKARPRRRPSPR